MTVGSAILLARLSPRGAALARAALLGRTSAAPLSTSAAVRDAAKGSSAEGYIHPVYFKVKETQKYYQQDNGLRVSAPNKGYRIAFSCTSSCSLTVQFQ